MPHPSAQEIDSQPEPATVRNRATTALLWLGGLVLILLALTVGKSIEDQLAATGMPDLAGGAPTPQQLAPLLFAFAFPLGLALCAAASLRPGRRTVLSWLILACVGVIVVAAPVLVPVLLGRELVSYHFGAGGIIIALSALATFWSMGRLRRALPASLAAPADLATLGLLCLAAAAWNLCGSAAMPSFLLMPDKLAELQTLPFAIGQMKSVLVLLAAGWAFFAGAAMLAASRIRRAAGHG